VSVNPFSADAAVAEHLARLDRERGDAIRGEVRAALGHDHRDPAGNMGGIVSAEVVGRICAAHGITVEQLMLLSLRVAELYSHPEVSSFTVGAIGLEAETGNLVLGGNLEFTRAHIGTTVHGEGFVFTRAFTRGTSIKTIAIGEAHPCAHCRQYLSEFAATANLTLIDPLGHRLTMAQLYPWPFDPKYLGETGIIAGAVPYPALELEPFGNLVGTATAACLTEYGRRSYTPYGKSPAALVLTLSDGNLVGGSAIESVAFNPTISPLQSAMIHLVAHGYSGGDIKAAVIATVDGARVDYILPTVDALAAIAPGIELRMLKWTA
jgi:cytidine deaminase